MTLSKTIFYVIKYDMNAKAMKPIMIEDVTEEKHAMWYTKFQIHLFTSNWNQKNSRYYIHEMNIFNIKFCIFIHYKCPYHYLYHFLSDTLQCIC